MNGTLIQMVRLWFIDKNLNLPFSKSYKSLSFTKICCFFSIFPNIRNILTFEKQTGLMILSGSVFIGVAKILLTK